MTAYRNDADLYRLVKGGTDGNTEGIDGVTEPLTVEGTLRLLTMPDAVTFELPNADDASLPPSAFVTARYATTAPDSIESFGRYFVGDVFDLARMRFTSSADEQVFDNALRGGNIIYLAEFVSRASRAATMALLVAVQTFVIRGIFGTESCTLFGKCLDAVRITVCTAGKCVVR